MYCTTHKSLNTSKGIVRCPALSKQSCEHILEFMGEQGVTDVRRINVHRDGALKPTNLFVFTFDSPVLPAVVRIGFIQAKVDVYIPNPYPNIFLSSWVNKVLQMYVELMFTVMEHSNQPTFLFLLSTHQFYQQLSE